MVRENGKFGRDCDARVGGFLVGEGARVDTSQQPEMIASVRFERHIFVCTQARSGGGKPSCGARGSNAIVSALERALSSRPELAVKIGVTACACLGPCFDGPNAVVYPDGVWYAGLEEGDVDDLITHLAGGEVVERRRYRWQVEDDE